MNEQMNERTNKLMNERANQWIKVLQGRTLLGLRLVQSSPVQSSPVHSLQCKSNESCVGCHTHRRTVTDCMRETLWIVNLQSIFVWTIAWYKFISLRKASSIFQSVLSRPPLPYYWKPYKYIAEPIESCLSKGSTIRLLRGGGWFFSARNVFSPQTRARYFFGKIYYFIKEDGLARIFFRPFVPCRICFSKSPTQTPYKLNDRILKHLKSLENLLFCIEIKFDQSHCNPTLDR